MSSYHSSFSYLNKNSNRDFGWIIAQYDADVGEMESYLTQSQVFTNSSRGTRRNLYGTQYSAVAIVEITVFKCDGSDLSVAECRNAYRWLTGNPQASWLDLYVGNTLQYSFFGTVQDVKPYKIDARTVGFNIYFESISPWAYSPLQTINCSFDQILDVDNGALFNGDNGTVLTVDDNGIVSNNTKTFSITNDGILQISNPVAVNVDNATDDLYVPIYLNTLFVNNNSDYLSILNSTTGEETILKNMGAGEEIRLSAEQFIISSIPNKIFGNDFNFVWPRLVPGVNQFVISGSGSGSLEFTYRYPIKIGDCAIDVGAPSGDIDCSCPDPGTGPTNDCDCTIDEQALQEMLSKVLV